MTSKLKSPNLVEYINRFGCKRFSCRYSCYACDSFNWNINSSTLINNLMTVAHRQTHSDLSLSPSATQSIDVKRAAAASTTNVNDRARTRTNWEINMGNKSTSKCFIWMREMVFGCIAWIWSAHSQRTYQMNQIVCG